MASKKSSSSKSVVIGPTQPAPSDPYGPMMTLPVRPAADGLGSVGGVTRRPFSQVTKNPLHYSDGPGTDEAVTSRRTQPSLASLLGDPDHEELTPIQGEDKNKYSAGPDESKTLNGVEIRGS